MLLRSPHIVPLAALPARSRRRPRLLVALLALPLTLLLVVTPALAHSAAGVELVEPAVAERQDPTVAEPAPGVPVMERAMFGAFTYGGVWQGMDAVLRLESELGRQLDIVHWFTNFDNDYYPEMVALASQGGRLPLISWQPHRQDVRDIAAGVHDDYLRSWAHGVRDSIVEVYLRPFPEMNGDWVPWNGDPEGLRAAWRHMAQLFEAEGARNVRWVFSPNVTDEPRTEANAMEAYYPGSDVVDVLALDGYNWGETRAWTAWRPFEDVFASGYERITRLGPQPVWFAEMASAPTGGDKAAWVSAMFASTAFDRLEALVWFDEHKEADWRMLPDERVASAFRAALDGRPTRAAQLAAIRGSVAALPALDPVR